MERGELAAEQEGPVTCAAWIRRPENRLLVIMGRAGSGAAPPLLEIFSFDSTTSSLSPAPLVNSLSLPSIFSPYWALFLLLLTSCLDL